MFALLLLRSGISAVGSLSSACECDFRIVAFRPGVRLALDVVFSCVGGSEHWRGLVVSVSYIACAVPVAHIVILLLPE